MAVPYIGSKLSLTSRSLIRYEGILASVDPKEATISLEQVRMMGTEGRLPGKEIAPSNDVYDLVVFKSADIEDLQIFEAPVQPPAPRPFKDPAIVSSSSMTSPPPPPSSSANMGTGGWPAAPRLQFGTSSSFLTAPAPVVAPSRSTQFGSLPSSSPSNIPINTSSSLQWNETKAAPIRAPTFGSLAMADAALKREPTTFNRPMQNGEPSRPHPSTLPKPAATTFMSTPSPSSPFSSASLSANLKTNDASVNSNDMVKAYNTVTGKVELVEKTSRSYAAVVSDGAGRFRVSGETTARIVPRAEYDFQQANARLQPPRELKTAAVKETFYDKSTSFFDNISCEATGKNEPRDRNERRLNIETFGMAAPSGGHHHHHYHRHGNHHQNRGGYRRTGASHSSRDRPSS